MTTKTLRIGEDLDPAQAQTVTLHRLTHNYAGNTCQYEGNTRCTANATWWFNAQSPYLPQESTAYVCSQHVTDEAETLWGCGWDLR